MFQANKDLAYKFQLEDAKRRIKEGIEIDAAGCWVWKKLTVNGSAVMNIHGKRVHLRRYLYISKYGALPATERLITACGHKGCINPGHQLSHTHFMAEISPYSHPKLPQ